MIELIIKKFSITWENWSTIKSLSSIVKFIDIWELEQICACRYIDYLVDIAYMIKHTDKERSERMNKYF